MKTLAILLCLFVFLPQAHGQDFRNITWGMSIDDVRAAEGRDVRKLGEGLYSYTVPPEETGGWDVSVRFHEYDGQVLQSAIIIGFPVPFEQHFDVYLEQKKQYTQAYGAPERDEVVWIDDMYKDTPDKWVSALILGDLVYQTDWQTDTSFIRMTLRDWDYSLYLTVYYRSLEHEQLVEEDDEERYHLPELAYLNGFKRYSQDDPAPVSEAWDKSTVFNFEFADHGSADHLLWGTHPLMDHSVDALRSELATAKKAHAALVCSQEDASTCDAMNEVMTDLERELAKRQ